MKTMEARLKIERKTRDQVCLLILSGCLDSLKTPEINIQIRKAIEDGHVKFICDLSEVRPISSAALGAFYTIRQLLRMKGGDLVLVGSNRKTLQMLGILEAARLFRVMTTRKDAFEYFTTPEAASKTYWQAR